jgi:outer membrane immunogenic protein
MNKLLVGLAGAVALSLSAPASAADLYTKAPPPPMVAAIYDWSGFYIGINGGGGSAHKCWDFVAPVSGTLVGEGCHNATGGTIGGQIGYRWQSTQWVFGIEGQGNWADFSGDNVSIAFLADRNRSRIDSFGLITGQVGYAWNNALLYVKGGAAVTDNKYEIISGFGAGTLASTTDTRWGGVVGVGLEYGFAPNWSAAVEYDHLFMQDRTYNFTAPAGTFVGTDRIRQDVDLVTVRVNYKFGGPVVGRY